ncbi:MAG: hypothetical protein LIP01_10580 [Tannerellaceae bacterium]|nr:hypothetical protein [Tannerellaceae bacterium]
MKEVNIKIRPIEKNDYSDIAGIYNYYVENSNAAFLETNIDVEFVESLHKVALKGSFLIADNGEKVIGFCLLKNFLPMENFKRTATITYFISPEYTRWGLGNLFLN